MTQTKKPHVVKIEGMGKHEHIRVLSKADFRSCALESSAE